MRRIPKKKPIKLPYEMAEYKPWFFWKRCCECGDEVRRETIYGIGIRWRAKRLGFFKCLCNSHWLCHRFLPLLFKMLYQHDGC